MTFSSKKISYIFPTIVVASLSLIPLVVNFKYNDHSKNWLNHDYGKNLLSSTEEHSVFMTEGGDNQVFSSLYFTYAEKLRQDLFPYDQKGNIYKKIYGDLRYVTIDTLEERRPIVDGGLFTGQEPFYEDIRSANKPYLVPYALGQPATYLTWKLSNPEVLGDFYYKNYGQMYKVQHIKYAILDYLEFANNESISILQDYIKNLIKADGSSSTWKNKWNKWISELTSEGYIKVSNNIITLIKNYKKPFRKDPKDTFLKRWDNIPNLRYYDYLSREIVNSFAFEQIGLIMDEVAQIKGQQISDSTQKTKVKEYTSTKWKEIEYYISLIEKSGYDSVAILHNLGIFYMSAQEQFDLEKSLLPEAVQTWEKVVDQFIYSWSTYDILLWSYLKLILQDEKNMQNYLDKFDHYYSQLTNSTTHWKSMKKDLKKSRPYQSTQRLVEFRKGINNVNGPNFEILKQSFISSLKSEDPQSQIAIQYLSTLLNRVSLDQNSEEIRLLYQNWEQAWNKLKRNPEFIEWHTQMMYEIVSGLDVGGGEKLLNQTLSDGATLIALLPNIQAKFNTGFYLVNIAKRLRLTKYEREYSLIVLEIGKENLPAEQFEQLKKQLTY
ncbi:MAG: hypothetical protein ACRCTJ_04090 [Brevinema sp.]